MKHKNLIRLLAIVLVLVMSIGILAACGDKKGSEPKQTEPEDEKVLYLTDSTSSEAFITAMFNSANQIGSGVTVDTSEGKNIAINLGLTLTIFKNNDELPIDVAIKAFIDRENVTAKDKDTGYYYLKPNNSTEIEISIKEKGIDFLKLVLKMVPDADEQDCHGIIYATGAGYNVKLDLATLCDVSDDISAENYLFNMFEGLLQNGIVKTIVDAFSGDDFDLNTVISGLINSNKEYVSQITVDGKKTWQFATSADDKHDKYVQIADGEYRKYNADTDEGEEVYRIVDLKYVSSRTHYNYDETTKEYVPASNGKYVVKTLADTLFGVGLEFNLMDGVDLNLGDILTDIIYGSESSLTADQKEEGIYKMFGEVLDIGSLLKALSPTLFPTPTWNIGGTEYSSERQYNNNVQLKANKALSARASLSLLGLDGLLGDSPLIGAIEIGFSKEKGEELTKTPTSLKGVNLGKMEELWLGITFSGIAGDGDFGLKLAVTDLAVGNTKEVSNVTVIDEDETPYSDSLAFDLGLDLTSDKDFMNILIKSLKEDSNINILVGGDKLDLKVNGENIDIIVPESLKVNIAGNVNLFSNLDTAIIIDIVAGKKGKDGESVIKGQIYGVENGDGGSDLVADIKVADEYVPLIEKILTTIIGITGEPIGSYNFKNNSGTWFFDKKDTKDVAYSELSKVFDNFVKTGAMRVEGLDLNRLITWALNSTDYKPFMNTSAVASADFGTVTMDFVLTSIMGKSKGILVTLYKLINVKQTDNESAIVIGGSGLLQTFANYFFDVTEENNTFANNGGVITPLTALNSLIDIIGSGNTMDIIMGTKVNAIDEYLDIEDTLIDGFCRGISFGDNMVVLMSRADQASDSTAEKLINEYNKSQKVDTLNEISEAGYAVVKDTDGKYTLYPKALYSYLTYNKDNAAALAKLGVTYTNNTFVVKAVDTLKTELVSALNTFGAISTDRSSNKFYLKSDDVVSILKQLYRQGISAVPYKTTTGDWTANDIAFNKNFVDDGLISAGDVSVSIYTVANSDDDNKLDKGGVKVHVGYIDKSFDVDVYMNLFSEKGLTASDKVEADLEKFYDDNVPATALYLDVVPVKD